MQHGGQIMTIQKRSRKSSAAVKLVLIGTAISAVAVTAGCGQKERRDVYANKETCLADWGNEPADCTPVAASGSGARVSGGGTYFGRSYPHINGETGPRSSRAIGSAMVGSGGVRSSSSSSISRGGFGSSGHSATS